MSLADQLIALGTQLSEERDAAFSLWTWLPSYKVAQKWHGDYADNFTPSVRDVMVEAAMWLGYGTTASAAVRPYTQEEKDWFRRCPCDEEHAGWYFVDGVLTPPGK